MKKSRDYRSWECRGILCKKIYGSKILADRI